MEILIFYKIVIILILLSIASRLKIHLAVSIFISGTLLYIWLGGSILDIPTNTASGIFSFKSINLLFIVFLVISLSELIHISNNDNKIIKDFSAFKGATKFAIAGIPAIIGLIPMPGGAVFSAPMVNIVSKKTVRDSSQKAGINYFFRHIWEFWWPLYPGIILASGLSEINLNTLMLTMLPFTIITAILGYFLLIHNVKIKKENHIDKVFKNQISLFSNKNKKIFLLLKDLSPILIIIFSFIFLHMLLFLAETINKENLLLNKNFLHIIKPYIASITVLIGVIYTLIFNKMTFLDFYKSIFTKKMLNMLLIVASVLIFKENILKINIASGLMSEFYSFGIPLVIIIIFLPFIMGNLSGLTIGGIGASFPIIIPLIKASSKAYLAFIMIAYFSAYIGVLVSPVHICLVATKDYFKTSFYKLLKPLLRIYLLDIIFAFIWFLILFYFS